MHLDHFSLLVDTSESTLDLPQAYTKSSILSIITSSPSSPPQGSVFKNIQNIKSDRMLVCLFDSGASDTIIKRSCLPDSVTPKILTTIQSSTLTGKQEIKSYVELRNIVLPEFSRSYKISFAKAYVVNSEHFNHDIIIGRDFLRNNIIKLSFENNNIVWMNRNVPMKLEHYWNKHKINWYHSLSNDEEHELFNKNYAIHHKPSQIKHSKYQQANPNDVIDLQNHLNLQQKEQLLQIFLHHTVLFNGKLGKYPHEKIHLDINQDACPFHAKVYAVPHLHSQVFKDELKRLCDIEVLEPCGRSEWAAGTFIIPKKDGRVRWVSDFRMLNKSLQRKKLPITENTRHTSMQKWFQILHKT